MAKKFELQEKDEELIKEVKNAHGRINGECMIIWDFDDASSYRDIINEKNIHKIIIDVECGIPRKTFSNCNTIREVIIRPGVTYIGESAFEDCKELRQIKIADGVTRIEKDAFSGCEHLTEVIIPDSVTDLGILAFYLCHNLRHITLSKNITSIGWKTFRECQNLKSIKIPNGVTQIGQYAFQDCCGLVSVEIPDSVTYIDIGAFYGCSSLVSATCNGVIYMMNYAFQDCSSLQTVMIGDNIKDIGYGAFFGCCNLEEVSLPSGIGYTKKYVFNTSKCKIIKRHIKEAKMAKRFDDNTFCMVEFAGKGSKLLYVEGPLFRNPVIFSDVYYYPDSINNRGIVPLILEQMNSLPIHEFDNDGREAWNKYKGKLVKEAEMAKNNKDLYNPKFVHFDWDESLIGKKGFCNDDIGCLKKEIRNEGTRMMGTLVDYCEESAPFLVQSPNNCPPSAWKFFYYDPHYEVKWAYFKEFKAVQRKCKRTVTWFDVGVGHDDVSFFEDDGYDYRIKPEEQKPEPKPNVEVNVDIKVSGLPDEKVEMTINGKKCVFENAEQAKKVLFDGE